MLKNKKVRGILQVLLSLTLLFLLLNSVGFKEVLGTLVNINPAWYLLAFGIFLLNIVIRSYRWTILLHSLNSRPPFRRLLYLYFLGFFANNFIPTGFGGDVVKVVSLRQRYGRGTEALSSVIMDRLTGLLGTSIIALVALTWNTFNQTTAIDLPIGLWLAIFAISFGIPAGFLLIRWTDLVGIMTARFPAIGQLPLYDRFARLVDTVHRYPFPTLLKALLISLPFTINLVLIQYSISRALGVEVPPILFPLFVPLISLINLLPFGFNGLGVREGVYLFLFVPAGVAPEEAIAMSLAYYFLRFGSGLVGGLLYAVSSVSKLIRSPHAEGL
jgi:uncharacterized membrane protein YbhN (UPF0104 family)